MKKELQVRGLVLFIMRVTFFHFILIISAISFANAHETFAQALDKRISIELHNISLRTALSKLERLSEAKFLYQSQVIPASERVSISASNERLADILERVLTPRQIQFQEEGNQIILTKKSITGARPSDQMLLGGNDVIQVSGIVTDEENQPLPGVNILVKGTTTGTTSDANGSYSLNVPDESSVLVFTFIGYTAQEIAVGTQTEINVQM